MFQQMKPKTHPDRNGGSKLHGVRGSIVPKLAVVAGFVICGLGLSAQVAPVPKGVTVLSRIEESSGWKTCGNCGNTGASGATASYSMNRGITSPNTDGSSTMFQISGKPYTNGYWYIGHTPSPATPLKYLRYEFDLYVPSASANVPQAIEFECQQQVSGHVYNFAWQANYAGKIWRVFDYVAKRWDPTALRFDGFQPNTWHHIIAEYHTTGTTVVHDALTIDGARHVVNLRHASKGTSSTGHYLTNAFQLDLNKYGTAYRVYVDGMKVSYK